MSGWCSMTLTDCGQGRNHGRTRRADAWFEVASGLDRAAAGLDVTLGDAEVGVLEIFPVVMPEASPVDVIVAVRNGASVDVLAAVRNGASVGVLELAGTLVGVVVGVLVLAGTLVGVVGVLGAIAVGVAVGVPRSPTPIVGVGVPRSSTPIVGVGVDVDRPIMPGVAEGVNEVAAMGEDNAVGMSVGVATVLSTTARPSDAPAPIAIAPDRPCTCTGTLLVHALSLLPSCPLALTPQAHTVPSDLTTMSDEPSAGAIATYVTPGTSTGIALTQFPQKAEPLPNSP